MIEEVARMNKKTYKNLRAMNVTHISKHFNTNCTSGKKNEKIMDLTP